MSTGPRPDFYRPENQRYLPIIQGTNMYRSLGLSIAVAVFASDLISKWLIVNVVMDPARVIDVFPFFNLVLGYNRGVTFGLLSSGNPIAPYLLSGFALLVVGVLARWLWRSTVRLESAAIGSIIGGALGNVADRLADGAVTDFLDFYVGGYHWPAFNLADVGIVLGVALLLVTWWSGETQRDDGTAPKV
tara:strand:+ start:516 stop:1082 length:567 start_codon:yes stop_codon:yes gene_type:complete